jgi:hypothetical protein
VDFPTRSGIRTDWTTKSSLSFRRPVRTLLPFETSWAASVAHSSPRRYTFVSAFPP